MSVKRVLSVMSSYVKNQPYFYGKTKTYPLFPEALKVCHKCTISLRFRYEVCKKRRLSYRILVRLNYSYSAWNTYVHING